MPLVRLMPLDSIRTAGQHVVITPDADELKAMAAFLDLGSIETLKIVYRLSRNGDRVSLKGEIDVNLHYICVVSLEPFPAHVKGEIALKFAPHDDVAAQHARLMDKDEKGAIDLGTILDGDDLPEVIENGVIDLGTVTTEQLSLLLDPYPRKPGATFSVAEPQMERISPFAALAKLKTDPDA